MPEPPDDLPDWIVSALSSEDEATLQATIDYAEALLEDAEADEEAAEGDEEEQTVADREPPEEWEGDADEWREAVADSEAPSRATLTTKTIKGNPYLYWQWTEGEKSVSEYIAPKNPKR